ncbi:MAG TPA: hypothetical protein VF676_11560 [Flavobacterium sp.]|jgi:hypothetical protein
MKKKERKLLKDYPGYFHNSKSDALEDFKKAMFKSIDEYIATHPENKQQAEYLREMTEKYFQEKRAAIYVESKLQDFSEYLTHSLSVAINNAIKPSNVDDTCIWYYKNKNQYISYE